MAVLIRKGMVLLWTLIGGYLALAGYFGVKLFEVTSAARVSSGAIYHSYGGLSFRTRQDLADFLLDETASRWFGWLPDVPAELMPLLACTAWGVLGAAFRMVYEIVRPTTTTEISWEAVVFSPILGAGVAIAVYLLAFLLPAVLTIGPNTLRAETIVALAFVSGLGSDYVYQWVQDRIKNLTT